MKASIIAWDLETVPDLGGFAAVHDLVGKSDAEIREAIGDKFPKQIYHSIVCIGALIAHWDVDHWSVDAVGAPHVAERTEKQLIAAFCDKIAELSPQLVTFNGNSFDLPVLRYRAMVHGLSAGRMVGHSSIQLPAARVARVRPRSHPSSPRPARASASMSNMEFDDGETVFRHACKMGLRGHRVQAEGFDLSLRAIFGQGVYS
jgi:hypothetical protein